MSSISKSFSGLRSIDVMVDGRRRRIYLGHLSKRRVEAIQARVNALVDAKKIGQRDIDAEAWCRKIDYPIQQRMMDIGLLPALKDETLRGLIDRFDASRGDVKKSTRATDKQTNESLLGWFGETRILRSISEADAEEWADTLRKDPKLAAATVAKRIIKAKAVFARAVKPFKMLEASPFADLKAGNQENPSRIRFIDAAISQSILEACPNAEWRGIFTMARWGGVRMPSEIANLRWTDVLWDKDKARFRIESPKTAHHKGGGERWCPLFREVYSALLELHELAEPGAEFVFSVKMRSASNLRTNMMRIIRRAGFTTWPKLFHNLRASRQTELTMVGHPLWLVCRWLGNSPRVADKHYLSLPDETFASASQNAAHSPDATARITKHESTKSDEKRDVESEQQPNDGRYRANSLRQSLRKILVSRGVVANTNAVIGEILELLGYSARQKAGAK